MNESISKINYYKKILINFIISVTVGLIFVTPHILFIITLKENYKGIFIMTSEDEAYYTAHIREIIDGHYSMANFALFENKNLPPIQYPIPELIIVGLSKILFLNTMDKIVIFCDFFFPFLITLLCIYFLYQLTNNFLFSSLGSLIIVYFLGDLSRPIIPQINLPFTLIFFILFYKVINYQQENLTLHKILLLVITGIIAGFLAYLYYYSWSYSLLCIVIFMLASLKNKKRLELMSLILIPAILVSIPHLLHTFKLANFEYTKDYWQNLGLIKSHRPSIKPSIYISTGIAFCYAMIKLNLSSKKFLHLFLFFVALLIAVNQNIITGKYLRFCSHYDIFIKFFLACSFILLISTMSKIFIKQKKIFICLIYIMVCMWASFLVFKNQINNFNQHKDKYKEYQSLKNIFDWLNKNTPKDSVILASNEILTLIPIYTANNIYYLPYQSMILAMPADEPALRLLRACFFFQLPKEKIEDYIRKNHRCFFPQAYIDSYQRKQVLQKIKSILGLRREKLSPYPIDKLKELVKIYKSFSPKRIKEIMKTYRIDYIIFSDYEKKKHLI